MNLLPKSHEEFASSEYWNRFFKKRGDKAFEWYGEYLELCEPIHKYIKFNDKILIVGCGNSKLGVDMYDAGYRNIVNIDISAVVIRKMKQLNDNQRSDMKFLEMDATQMSFDNEQFSVVLDKGTLDALFVNNEESTQDTVKTYLKEISRVMRTGGRYLCVSLLQEHILNYVVNYFTDNSFMLRIVHCRDADNAFREKNADNPTAIQLPVFMVVATKFKALPSLICEFSFTNDKIQRLNSTNDLQNCVKSVQRAALICNGLSHTSIAGHNEIVMEIYQPGDTKVRYTLYILEQQPNRELGKYAAFIVPQGREMEWLFASPEGRRKLLSSVKYQRLGIFTMHHDQIYESIDAVKMEISDVVKILSPSGLKDQIPFLSLECELGKREILVCGKSKISGEFRVEEVECSDGRLLRRLIFLSNQLITQSEALIKISKRKGRCKGSKLRKKIDFGYLSCQHHIYMSVGVQMAINMKLTGSCTYNKNVLVIGLGGGGLCSFLHKILPKVELFAVEIDPVMLEVAEMYFDLQPDDNFHVIIDDGLSFIEKCKEDDVSFDVIIFDVDSKDVTTGMSCPPPNFLSAETLANVKAVLAPGGFFILNLVCRNDSLSEQVMQVIVSNFASVCRYKLTEDLNEVIYCTNNEKYCKATAEEWRQTLTLCAKQVNNKVKALKLNTDDIVEIGDFMNDLKIE